jgi:hypothetical protein
MYNSVRICSLTFNFVRKKCRVVILQKEIWNGTVQRS